MWIRLLLELGSEPVLLALTRLLLELGSDPVLLALTSQAQPSVLDRPNNTVKLIMEGREK